MYSNIHFDLDAKLKSYIHTYMILYISTQLLPPTCLGGSRGGGIEGGLGIAEKALHLRTKVSRIGERAHLTHTYIHTYIYINASQYQKAAHIHTYIH